MRELQKLGTLKVFFSYLCVQFRTIKTCVYSTSLMGNFPRAKGRSGTQRAYERSKEVIIYIGEIYKHNCLY